MRSELIVFAVLACSLCRDRFILSDPQLKELYSADYCVTELGGASIPDFKLRPTLSFFQSTAEKGEREHGKQAVRRAVLTLHFQGKHSGRAYSGPH